MGYFLDPNCHHTFDKLQSGSTTVYEYSVRIIKTPDAGLATAKLVDLASKNTHSHVSPGEVGRFARYPALTVKTRLGS